MESIEAQGMSVLLSSRGTTATCMQHLTSAGSQYPFLPLPSFGTLLLSGPRPYGEVESIRGERDRRKGVDIKEFIKSENGGLTFYPLPYHN